MRELEKDCHLVDDRSCRGDVKIVLGRCMDKNSDTLNLLVVFVLERCMDKNFWHFEYAWCSRETNRGVLMVRRIWIIEFLLYSSNTPCSVRLLVL